MHLLRAYQGKPSERGVALLIVLLLITVMSTVAYAVTDDIRFAIRRTANLRISGQMGWYARGAESLARKVVWTSWKANPQRTTLADPWARQGVVFPIDGGSIAGRISDGGTCFNLNSVVERGPAGLYGESPAGRAQFTALLIALEFDRSQAAALTGALVDWIDGDSIASSAGAEDDAYGLLTVPYRTGGTLLAEPSELRAIAGYTEVVYERLRPLVCALPTPDLTRLNINTIRVDQAPLIMALMGGALRVSEVERMLANRPEYGFASVNDFLAADVFTGIALEPAVRDQFVPYTRYFQSETTVHFHAGSLLVSTLLEVDPSGRVTTHVRRLGSMD